MNDFQINSVIFCEDIRREITQKDILIGVFSSDIIVHALPARISLAFWIEITPRKPDGIEIFFRLDAPGSESPLEMTLAVENTPNQDSIAIYTPPLLCLIEKAGLITLSVKSGQDGQYKVVKSRKVRHEPPPPGAFRADA